MLCLNRAATGDDVSMLHRIGEFTNIAWPIVLQKRINRFWSQYVLGEGKITPCCSSQEVPGQVGNVRSTIS